MTQPQAPIAPPNDKLLRLPEVLARVPVGRATWFNGVKTGRFPAGVKLGPKTTCWRESDITALIRSV
jgi:prophage regulatory protein